MESRATNVIHEQSRPLITIHMINRRIVITISIEFQWGIVYLSLLVDIVDSLASPSPLAFPVPLAGRGNAERWHLNRSRLDLIKMYSGTYGSPIRRSLDRHDARLRTCHSVAERNDTAAAVEPPSEFKFA